MATTFNTGTASTPAKFSQREDLANFISNIVRDDVPFMSSIGKGKATAVKHEWSTDTLERPGVNAAGEGESFPTTASAGPNVERLGNYSQIFTKSVVVSGTIESVNKAGRKSEFKYQSEKRGKEMMRDIEYALVAAKGVSTGTITERKFGGYQSWVPAANAISNGTITISNGAGTGTNLPTFSANTATFSLSMVDDVMQNVWQNGGKPTTLMMSPKKKRAFSTAAQGQTIANVGVNNVRRNIDDSGKLRQSVEMYESDFGLVKVIPNYIMAAKDIGSGATTASRTDTDILVYDSSSFKMATLRPLHHRDISEDGDRLRALMVHETTLECMNPDAVGLIGGLAS